MTLDPAELSRLARTVRAAAVGAGEIIRSAAATSSSLVWEHKGAADFVSEVDRNAEQHILSVLGKEFPGAIVIGEEFSPEAVSAGGLAFIIDPLDGTTNFLHGFPSYAVSIAAALDSVLQAGVVLHVPRNEIYSAFRGGGAWLGEQRLNVSSIADPEFALIGTGFPFRELSRLEEYQEQFARVARGTSGIRRPGSAAIDLADVAAGRFDGFWEQHLSAWDIAAGSLLIREAGGIVTDLSGRDIGIEHTSVVAGNPAIHRWLIETLDLDK